MPSKETNKDETNLRQVTFTIDEAMSKSLGDLQRKLHAPSGAAVFRKALVLMQIAVDHAEQSDMVVAIRGKKEHPEDTDNIILRG